MPWTKKSVLLIAFYLRLPVIGLSLGRNTYTLRLSHASSDAGLDSAIVTIWLEVQLAYALAASTLSALKAFTESFETGFGLGFTRGKSENGSYALSGMSGSGNGTTTTTTSQSKNPEQQQQQQQQHQRNPSAPLHTIRYEDTTPHARPLSPASKTSSTQPLRLRPDLAATATATATATASASATSETGTAPWHHSSGGSSSVSSLREERSEPLVIMRETELSVRREVAPGYGQYRSRSAMM